MDWSLEFLTPSDFMAQATEALTTTVTSAVTSSITLNGAALSEVINLEGIDEEVLPRQLYLPVKISASAAHPVAEKSPEWRQAEDGKLVRPMEAHERYCNSKGDDAWPLTFAVKIELGELDEVLFVERIRQVWGQIAIENPHATSIVQDSMFICEVLDSEERVQKWVDETVIVDNKYNSASELHYNHGCITGTKLFYLVKPRQLVLCSPHSRLDAHGAFLILHTLLSKSIDIPARNIVPGIPAPSIEQALGAKNTTMAHEQQAKGVLMEVQDSLPSLWLRPDLSVHTPPQQTEHSSFEFTEQETASLIEKLHKVNEEREQRNQHVVKEEAQNKQHYTVTTLLYTGVIATLKQQEETKSLKYFCGPCTFDMRPSIGDKSSAETLFGMMATQWPVVIKCESPPPPPSPLNINTSQSTQSNGSLNGGKPSSLSNGSLSSTAAAVAVNSPVNGTSNSANSILASRTVPSAAVSPVSATFNLTGVSSPPHQSSPVSAAFSIAKKAAHLRSVASHSTFSTVQSSAVTHNSSPEEVEYLQRIMENVAHSFELPKRILRDNMQDGIGNPVGSIKPMAHAASTVLKQLMVSEVVHPTPVVNSVGDCERFLRRRYGSSIKVKDIWIGTDCVTPKVIIMAWTFASKLHIEMKYNNAYYSKSYIEKFLADMRKYITAAVEAY
ncbi:hypothetical protein TRVA0_006S00584 [Trichomonascus vanleenenianus]|uniref:uncharacterized protein n=1 Tax=Trichomonascus vanleenenianus TaxID=2268995 RepID=UPI003ECB7B68